MMENNQIIEAEYREITPEAEFIRLADEINFITEQTRTVIGRSMFEIGKRFAKAKSLAPYGRWGELCERYTGYSQSMAENYIRIYEECASEQQTLFEGSSEVLEKFGITKAVELLAVPASERREFIEKNNITDESTTVKELRELIRKQREETEAAEQKAADAERELEAAIAGNQRTIDEKTEEINRLKSELEQREADPLPPPRDEIDQMLKEQEEIIKESMREEIDRLKKERKNAEEKNERLERKYDKLKEKGKKSEKDIQELKDKLASADDKANEDMKRLREKISEETDKNKALKEEIRRLQKESMLGANEKLVKLNIQFEMVQNDISKLRDALESVKESETYDKLRSAVYQTLKSQVERLEP